MDQSPFLNSPNLEISLPQLPIEVWERVIDCIAEDNATNFHRKWLLSCCLTCRAWVPRSRHHIFAVLSIFSRQELINISKVLSDSPYLYARIRHLSFGNPRDGEDTWLSVLPLELGPKLINLKRLFISYINLSKTSTHFYQALSCFPPLDNLQLSNIECARFNPILRISSAVRARSLSLEIEEEFLTAQRNPRWANSFPSPFSSNLQAMTFEIPPSMLAGVPWTLFKRPLWLVRIITPFPDLDSPEWVAFRTTLRGLSTLLSIIFPYPNASTAGITLEDIDSHQRVELGGYIDNSTKPIRDMKLVSGLVVSDDADAPFHRVKRATEILRCLDDTRFDDLRVYLGERSHFLMPASREWLAQWKDIDDALALPQFSNLSRVEFWNPDSDFQDSLLQADCAEPLLAKRFPKLGARNPMALCSQKPSCKHHSWKINPLVP